MICPRPESEGGVIAVRGARQNNLKGIDCDIPLGRLTVITGVSGSGKSSLAFDTLYAEGQRRYIETFSAYTRQFLDRVARPQADSIEGIPPAVAIDQSGAIKTSRSTVGTMTGINDYLKLLYARAADAICPRCGRKVEPEDTGAVLDHLEGLAAREFPVLLVAPVALGGFESPEVIGRALLGQGYLRFLRAGEVRRLEELEAADCRAESLAVVVDRLADAGSSRARRADSIEQAFRAGRGTVTVRAASGERTFTAGRRCGDCGVDLPRPVPGLFSFNNPCGACARCRGFGRVIEIDWRKVIPDPRLSLRAGAVKPLATASRRPYLRRLLRFCEERGIPADVPFASLTARQRELVLEGASGFGGVRGFFRKLERKKYKMHVRVLLARFRGYEPCPDCGGARLRPEALCFRLEGRTLPDLWAAPVRELVDFFGRLEGGDLPRHTALLVEEAASRLRYLDSVGLDYLTLGRQSRTLSGGEVERVNLTAALGACLVNTLFVLDEPSIGLHARDNDRLLEILRQVRARGNTVVVVEHDPAIIRAADHLLDLGPGAGAEGGEVTAAGTAAQIAASPRSLTGAYLSGRKRVPLPASRRAGKAARRLAVRGAAANNLKGIDLDLPLDLLVVVTGVSGSGKSSLLEDVIWKGYRERHGGAAEEAPEREDGGPARVGSIAGFHHVDEVVLVDQSPIGRTPRGNIATYSGIFDRVRQLFAATPEARIARLGPGSFSFNVEGGRCPDCGGAGATQVEMQFLSDVTLPCEACGGKRFQRHILDVRYHGRNVDEVLSLTVREAMAFFEHDLELLERLTFLDGLGLGYLRLGQPINTLSGGEAQRLKLAGKVMEAKGGKLLFLLDEPTTGLHLDDVARLLDLLRGLVEAGHGAIVIEHHLDVIAAADHVVDLGPEGGDAGGRLVAQGTPEEIASGAGATGSITGEWLRRHLSGRGPVAADVPEKGRPGPGAAGRGAACIHVVGARENNLRDVTVNIPRDELVVVTGLSGAGKSSLLYDIVFAEGQRRYLDCLSPYARQFVEDLHRPDIDHLDGIPPTVAVEQRTAVGGRKSTVGTVTEVHQFLRLLFTRVGVQVCPDCDVDVAPRTRQGIRDEVLALARRGGRLLAPLVRGRKGFHSRILLQARKRGFEDAFIDGQWIPLPEDRELRLDRHRAHDIDVVVARFRPRAAPAETVRLAVDDGLELGGGVVRFLAEDGGETLFNLRRSCPVCGRDFEEPEPRNFSFQSRHGACGRCGGYGSEVELVPERLLERWDLPLAARDGPLAFLDDGPFAPRLRGRILRHADEMGKRGVVAGGSAAPPARWGKRALRGLLEGDVPAGFPGLLRLVEAELESFPEGDRDRFTLRYGREVECPACAGGRLQRDALWVRVGGLGIADMGRLPVSRLRAFFAKLRFPERTRPLGDPIAAEVLSRLDFLVQVGLGYLTLERPASTLSTGEAQRIRLAAQLGSNLRGACYILDEPTIGLHPRDGERLIETLRGLRDRGNSVLVVEHDEAMIAAADTVLDMGPGPGRRGGEVVAQGNLAEILACERSATGRALRERAVRQEAGDPGPRSEPERFLARAPAITVRDARLHNLRGLSVRFPLGALTVVTGVSGAGKSTLVREVLEESVRRALRGVRRAAAGCGAVEGAGLVEAVREVDQLPIGRTPRSTPATYVGFWNRIRAIFAATAEARARGYGERRFSFNVAGGRCDACAGQGRVRMEMNFLPDVSIDCETCRGRRFHPQTLEVTYRGKSVADILEMTVEEALAFFDAYPELKRMLGALADLGLGYLTLGQASTTLSGGEAQRVKLAVELAKSASGACLYLLDEPTTGLHLLDVEGLVSVLRRLARAGHAVVVIEHHGDVIRGADWVIDLGPEGGEGGGELLYEGPPRGLLAAGKRSHTARCLRERWSEAPQRA